VSRPDAQSLDENDPSSLPFLAKSYVCRTSGAKQMLVAWEVTVATRGISVISGQKRLISRVLQAAYLI
jgi:hypothetical protein